jgi:hypothetical protein
LSSQEGLQELEEQDLKGVTGGVLDPTPLFSPVDKMVTAIRDEPEPHSNNGTYEAPAWTQNKPTPEVPNPRVHVYPASWYQNTSLKPNH